MNKKVNEKNNETETIINTKKYGVFPSNVDEKLKKDYNDFYGKIDIKSPNVFVDGWDFSTHVGNAQSRGEVFTPRFIVDKMIHDGKILPKKVIEGTDFSTNSFKEFNNNNKNDEKEQLLKTIELLTSKVLEPAIGSGNFSASILWYKLRVCVELCKTINNNGKTTINVVALHELFLKTISSSYGFDVDYGNVLTTRYRILGKKLLENNNEKENNTIINKLLNKDYDDNNSQQLFKELFGENIVKNMAEQTFDTFDDYSRIKIEFDSLEKNIYNSCLTALKNWHELFGKTLKNGGVIEQVWSIAQEFDNNVPNIDGIPGFTEDLKIIIEHNYIIFNGISEVDELVFEKKDNILVAGVPGYKNIVWSWWSFDRDNETLVNFLFNKNFENNFVILNGFEGISFMEQILTGKIKNLKQEVKNFKKTHLVSKNVGFFESSEWDTPENKIEFNLLTKNLSNHEKFLKDFHNGTNVEKYVVNNIGKHFFAEK